jgi:hypothetical protein
MEYKKHIILLIEQVDDNDIRFLRQIYTIIKMHLKRCDK